ncbi:hypothetical protein V2J09_021914 [Rumex salicifolius]
MGPDLDSKGKSRTKMDISPGEAGTAAKELDKMTCSKNCQDISFLTEALPNEHTLNQSEGPEINITDKIKFNEKADSESESEDATENSSSFSDTDSGIRNGPNDMEVESELHDDGSSSLPFDGFGDLFRTRKKKLTAEWKKFARPLLWRCKWLELQIRELDALGSKYEREIAEYDRRKEHDLLNITSEDISVKCEPITFQNKKISIMKRKKRKRVEDETDIASYMSNHNIFSTLVNRKSYADRPYMDDDIFNSVKPAKYNYISDEFDDNGVWACLDCKDDHRLEAILQNIEESQIRLRMLKARMDKVISENATTIFSNIEASTPTNALPASSPNHMAHENGDGPEASLCTTSQHTSADGEDVLMPDSAVSSHGDITPLLDMAETSDQTQIGVPCLKIKDEVMISDESVKEEVGSQPIGKPKVKNADELPAQQGAKVRQQVSKLGSPKIKRKRPQRKKSRLTKYSRRSSG